MKRKALTVLLASVALFVVALPAFAHHSFAAAYDTNNPITVKGVIVQVRLENPHSWFFLDVKGPDGKLERWSFEAGTPSGMIRNGFKPGVIKAGTEVTIKGYHARDLTQKMGMLNELVTADGKVYGQFGPKEGPGAQ
jgi:uncharacterized protein DUF6152